MPTPKPVRNLLGLAVSAAALTQTARADFNTLELFGNAAGTTPAAEFNLTGTTLSILGGGTDYYGNSDNGTFLWDSTGTHTVTGDFTASVRHIGTTNPAPDWGRDGIMARATQTPGTLSPTDAYWMACRNSNSRLVVNRRSTPGGATYRATDVGNATVNYNSDDNDRSLLTGPVNNTPWFLSAGRSFNRLYMGHAMDLGNGTPGRFVEHWSTEVETVASEFFAGKELIVGLAHQSHPQTISPDTNDINTATFDNWNWSDTFDFTRFGTAAGANSWQAAGSVSPDAATGQVHGSAYISEFGVSTDDPVKWTLRVYPLSSFSPSFGISGARKDPTGMTTEQLVPAENFRQAGEGSPPGLKADIYINSNNAGNLAANLNLIANAAAANKASTVVPRPYWGPNNYPQDENFQNIFALAHPGQFGGDQKEYGVELTGQMFIPGDADRVQPNLPGEFIIFKDAVDDFCYLEIDGRILLNDNDWTDMNSTGNGGGNITVLDVSDPKFNNGAWVSFRMITWEGDGGDNVALYWDQNPNTTPLFTVDTVPGTFGNLVPLTGVENSRKDASPVALEDLVPPADFRHSTESGTAPGLRVDIYKGGNPGNLEAINNNISGSVGFAGTATIPTINWFNSTAGRANYPSDGAGGDIFGSAGVAVEAANGIIDGNGYKEYGTNITGQIFIPGDAQRAALPVAGGNNLVLFKDGVDDFTYLEIDGQVLINDNIWTGPGASDNGGGQVSLMNVSDAKFDDGEWVDFRMVTWEGGGGDSGVLYWSARDANGTFGTSSVPGSTAPSFEATGVGKIGDEANEDRFGTLTLPAGDWLTVLRVENTGTALQRIGSASVTAAPGATFDITSLSYNPATSLLSLTFSSQAGSNYALEYTTGFQAAGSPPSPARWNTVPTHNNIAGQNGTTTITPLSITTLVAPAGQLPDAGKCFFRIRKL